MFFSILPPHTKVWLTSHHGAGSVPRSAYHTTTSPLPTTLPTSTILPTTFQMDRESHHRACKSPSPVKDKTTSKRKRNEGAKVTVSKKKNAGKSSRKKAASSPLPKTGTARSIAAAAAKVVVSPSAKAVSQPITPEDETNAKTNSKAVQKNTRC